MVIGPAAVGVVGGAMRDHPGVVTRHIAARRCCLRHTVMRGVDRQSAVHDARMQLHWLGETDGEPHGHDGRKGAKYPGTLHLSNIDDPRGQESGGGAARAIRPIAAINFGSVSGSHPTSHRIVR